MNSSLDYKTFQRDKKGKKTNIFLETQNQKNSNKISVLLQKIKGERASLVSQEDSSPPPRFSIESPFIPHLEKSEIKEDLTENDLQKPIFLYLPQEDEIRGMILGVLREIAKENEFFKKIDIPKRRKR